MYGCISAIQGQVTKTFDKVIIKRTVHILHKKRINHLLLIAYLPDLTLHIPQWERGLQTVFHRLDISDKANIDSKTEKYVNNMLLKTIALLGNNVLLWLNLVLLSDVSHNLVFALV